METEYALHFTPADPGGPTPHASDVFHAVLDALEREVPGVRPGGDFEGKSRWFGANGMSVCFEHTPWSDSGLVEVATPECLGAEACIVRLRAADCLLLDATAGAEAKLSERGFPGDLRFVKHGRDPDGEVYGRQLNMDAAFARGWRLCVWRVAALFVAALHIPAIVALTPFVVALLLVSSRGGELDPTLLKTTILRGFAPVFALLESVLLAARWVGFRDVRTAVDAYLASAPVIAGTGHLDHDGRFWLSGRAEACTTWMSRRLGADPTTRECAVLNTGSLLKLLMRELEPRAYAANVGRLLGPRQRLQVSVDAQRAEVAEALAVGTLDRVVRLAEAGLLQDAPRFPDPLAALRTWASDPTLTSTALDANGRVWTGLAVQRWYQERARTAFPDDPLVQLWGDALAGLATDPTAWVGRIDWVTKRWLLEQVAHDADPAVRKRVDQEYHLLGHGLYDRVLAVLDVPPLTDPEAVRAARTRPPDGPARVRSLLIRAHGDALEHVGWDRVRLKGRILWLGR